LAAYGDTHFHVAKHVAGERTVTEVRALTGEERVTELAQMMGAESAAGRTSVTEMMAQVMDAKQRK
jgi:DNA repair protein RecN (Recombination protein N)